jgi:chromosome segregation ATPase
MEETEVMLARHEQRIKTLEREMVEMKTVQAEIRSMNDTLVTLTNELKHANEHLARHEQKIDEIKSIPGQRMQQISTAVISALAGGLISMLLGMVLR